MLLLEGKLGGLGPTPATHPTRAPGNARRLVTSASSEAPREKGGGCTPPQSPARGQQAEPLSPLAPQPSVGSTLSAMESGTMDSAVSNAMAMSNSPSMHS